MGEGEADRREAGSEATTSTYERALPYADPRLGRRPPARPHDENKRTLSTFSATINLSSDRFMIYL